MFIHVVVTKHGTIQEPNRELFVPFLVTFLVIVHILFLFFLWEAIVRFYLFFFFLRAKLLPFSIKIVEAELASAYLLDNILLWYI